MFISILRGRGKPAIFDAEPGRQHRAAWDAEGGIAGGMGDEFAREVHQGFVLSVRKQFPGAAGVARDAYGVAFAGFDAGGGEADQAFEKIGQSPLSAAGVPEAFPDFVGFPVVAMIEQIHAETKIGMIGERLGLGIELGMFPLAEAMAGGIGYGIRMPPGHEGIRRKRNFRSIAG